MAQYSWQAIGAEIGPKGKGYLILKESRPDRMPPALREGAEELLRLGAREVYVSGDALGPEEAERLGLTYVHRMQWMARSLRGLPAPTGRLSLRPLTAETGEMFLALYNDCFFSVPNSATYTEEDLARMEREGCLAGFAVTGGGETVGIYELRPGGAWPEISSVGLTASVRGQGLGRELMLAVMAELRAGGAKRCRLMVSSANEAACRLYESLGFRLSEVISHWYRLPPDDMQWFHDI